LKNAIESGNALLIAEAIGRKRLQAYRLAKRRGLEGVVAKGCLIPYLRVDRGIG